MFSPAKFLQGAAALAQRLVGTPEKAAVGGQGKGGPGKSKLGTPAGSGKAKKRAPAKSKEEGGARTRKSAVPRAKGMPVKPTRPASTYLSFCQTYRKEVAGALPPGAKPTEVTKALAERWGSATASQKAAAEKVAAKARKRYEKEMQAYQEDLAKFEARAVAAVANLPSSGPQAPKGYKKEGVLLLLKKMKPGLVRVAQSAKRKDAALESLYVLVEGGHGPVIEAAAAKYVFKEKGRSDYRAFLTEIYGFEQASKLYFAPARKKE